MLCLAHGLRLCQVAYYFSFILSSLLVITISQNSIYFVNGFVLGGGSFGRNRLSTASPNLKGSDVLHLCPSTTTKYSWNDKQQYHHHLQLCRLRQNLPSTSPHARIGSSSLRSSPPERQPEDGRFQASTTNISSKSNDDNDNHNSNGGAGSSPPLSWNRYPPSNVNVQVLSKDPLMYVVPNLLSALECEEFIHRVNELEQQGIRTMKRSNPPQVSLEVQKLWPLPFLSIGAGIPPLVRIFNDVDTSSAAGVVDLQSQQQLQLLQTILSNCLPPIIGAFIFSLVLAYGVVVPSVQTLSNNSLRTSVAMAFNLSDDITYIHKLVDRVCSITNHPWYSWEAPVITKYNPGAIFAKHSDASSNRGKEWKNEGGQRIITCICYLNTIDDGGGGETFFDQLDIKVRPTQGTGLFFYPTKPGNSLDADDRMTHESLPSVEQDKCIIQMFGRIGPRVPSPLGIPDSYEYGNDDNDDREIYV